jgi:hypothetical protein
MTFDVEIRRGVGGSIHSRLNAMQRRRTVRPSAKCLVLVSALVLTATIGFGLPLRVLAPGLPIDSDYQASVNWMIQNANLLEVYNSHWDFAIAKDEVIKKVKDTLARTDGYLKENLSSDDVWLFKALLEQYLYNLDLTLYGEQIIKDASDIRAMFPTDYRPVWLLAWHDAKAGRIAESIENYGEVLARFSPEGLSPYFWVDYAEAAYLAGMPIHSREALERAGKLLGKDFITAHGLYKAVSGLLVDPVPNLPMSADDTYVAIKRGDGYGILSHLFGMWIPTGPDWKVNRGGTKDNNSAIALGLAPLQNKVGRNIFYSIVILSSAYNNMSFEQYAKQNPVKGATLSRIPDLLQGAEQQAYEWKNPDLYKQIGGGHGICVFVERHEPNVRGLSIEEPSYAMEAQASKPVGGSGASGAQFFRFKKIIRRYPGDIFYTIILDTSEDIFEQSRQEFKLFLAGLILE